jgi:hypothetical protein
MPCLQLTARLGCVQRVPLPVPSREWLYLHLHEQKLPSSVAYWLGSNLVPREGGGFSWSFNIQGAAAMYHSYR